LSIENANPRKGVRVEWPPSFKRSRPRELVVKGRLTIKLRGRDVTLDPGEFLVVERGVEHQPVAVEEVHVLLFEPVGTINTGNVQDERTVRAPERI